MYACEGNNYKPKDRREKENEGFQKSTNKSVRKSSRSRLLLHKSLTRNNNNIHSLI